MNNIPSVMKTSTKPAANAEQGGREKVEAMILPGMGGNGNDDDVMEVVDISQPGKNGCMHLPTTDSSRMDRRCIP